MYFEIAIAVILGSLLDKKGVQLFRVGAMGNFGVQKASTMLPTAGWRLDRGVWEVECRKTWRAGPLCVHAPWGQSVPTPKALYRSGIVFLNRERSKKCSWTGLPASAILVVDHGGHGDHGLMVSLAADLFTKSRRFANVGAGPPWDQICFATQQSLLHAS